MRAFCGLALGCPSHHKQRVAGHSTLTAINKHAMRNMEHAICLTTQIVLCWILGGTAFCIRTVKAACFNCCLAAYWSDYHLANALLYYLAPSLLNGRLAFSRSRPCTYECEVAASSVVIVVRPTVQRLTRPVVFVVARPLISTLSVVAFSWRRH